MITKMTEKMHSNAFLYRQNLVFLPQIGQSGSFLFLAVQDVVVLLEVENQG